jgi:anthrone oxygenase-like protein
VNRSIESVIRFVNLTTAGLLAGSLGFGEAALVPGWKEELPRDDARPVDPVKTAPYFNSIGPVALATAVTLAVAAPRGVTSIRRVLDSASAVALAGVLGATIMVTVPINKELQAQPASDYPSDRSQSLARNWSRAHAVRTTLGIGAFVCAVAASNLSSRKA